MDITPGIILPLPFSNSAFVGDVKIFLSGDGWCVVVAWGWWQVVGSGYLTLLEATVEVLIVANVEFLWWVG